MVLTDIRKIEMVDIPEPRIENDDDVKIRMKAVGLCGSDVHYYATGRIGDQIVKYPFTVGHEGAGIVEEVGPGVTKIKKGDRIAIEPAISCYNCDQCNAGRPHTCRNLKFLGCPKELPGCFCDYLVMPERNCFLIEDDTTFQQAALVEPLSIGVYTVKRAPSVKDANIAILGAGPIGLSTYLASRAQGVNNVYITDKEDYRVDIAANRPGVTWAGNPDKEDIVAKITEAEPMGVDVVFEACGQPEAIQQAIDLCKPGGTIVVVGIPEVDMIPVFFHGMRRKELTLRQVRRQNECQHDALDLVQKEKLDVDFMVTHHFKLDEVDKAFELVDNYDDGIIKAMIEI